MKTEVLKLKRYFIVWIGIVLMLLTVLLTLFTTLADNGCVWDFQFLYEQVIKNLATLIFPMCITLITGYMISREYTDDTLKNIVTIPVSYQKLLLGKIVVSAILSLLLGAICFLFTVTANVVMGYEGLTAYNAFCGICSMSFLCLFLYLSILPIIVLTGRKQNAFLAGVILAFVYGFCGMFVNDSLNSVYPVTAAMGMINYRGYVSGVHWNIPLCIASVFLMFLAGLALTFIKPKPEKQSPASRSSHL